MVPNSELVLNQVLTNPTRIGFFATLKKMGVGVEFQDQWEEAGEQIGNLKIFYQTLNSTPITIDNIPRLIDEIPVIAILATQAEGKMEIRGAEELRIKECDRIHAICKNLKKMGADIHELDDGFIINGPTPLYGSKIETFYDHRIAMAFSIAGLITDGIMVLDHPECASISYPEFYDELERVKQ